MSLRIPASLLVFSAKGFALLLGCQPLLWQRRYMSNVTCSVNGVYGATFAHPLNLSEFL
jgi:hypothetical protein